MSDQPLPINWIIDDAKTQLEGSLEEIRRQYRLVYKELQEVTRDRDELRATVEELSAEIRAARGFIVL